jgi:UDP-4-amino-4,6-dideoxy-N-acetyl-beta-L-altrosamine N-acetyltransferase
VPLRLLVEADLPLVLSWRNATEVRQNMYSNHEITEAEHREWFIRLKADTQSRWFVHMDDSGQPDGVVYFTQIQLGSGSAFWGFYADPSAAPGTGTLLGIDSLDKAFLDMELHKLNAEALVSNTASLRFQKKLGFQQEGLFRDFHFDGEHYVDVVRLGIIATEWVEKREEILTLIAQRSSITHPGLAK